jgi:hypothetical protein
LIYAEEENIQRKVGTAMAFAGTVSQTLEGVRQFTLNPVRNGPAGFTEQVTPDLLEILFGFWSDGCRVSRSRAVGKPRRLVSFKTLAQLLSPNAFPSAELSKAAFDFGVDPVLVFLQPSLSFGHVFPGHRRAHL